MYYQEKRILPTRGYGFGPDGTKQQRFSETTSPDIENAKRNEEIRGTTHFWEIGTAESDEEFDSDESEKELHWKDDGPEPYMGKTCRYKAPKGKLSSKSGGGSKQGHEIRESWGG